MSVVCYHVRTTAGRVASLDSDPSKIFGEIESPHVEGIEVVYIDKAYDALAWLASPTKRAETIHSTRVMFDRDWPIDEVRASVARLDAMPLDDALTAIEGRSSERVEAIDFGSGAAAIFSVERVRELSVAMSALTEECLRLHLDFAEMDKQGVQPEYWVEEGEDTFSSYLMPNLKILQGFYASAAANNEVVLVIWT